MRCVFALAACLWPAALFAQAARPGKLQVTVVDPSGAIVQDATVTLVALEPAAAPAALAPIKTSDKGVAILESVPPGRYSIRAEFPGFDMGLLRDIRVRSAGESKHVVVLPLSKLEDSVTVGRDVQAIAADRRTSEFGVSLSRDQIEALSDDPSELSRQLNEIAGPDAIVRVDSFEGQQLPPKAQIKSIRVIRDQFAAEAAQPGSTFVEIVTQPGVGALRGGFNFGLRDGSMTGRSRFTPTKGPEQFKDFGGNVGGTLVKGKTSFNASMNGQTNYVSPILNVALPDGTRAETLGIRQPSRNTSINAVVDHAVTRDQTLRVGFSRFWAKRENQGIGAYDLPERAFTQENKGNTIRTQLAGPLGRRSFINSRVSYNWLRFWAYSKTSAPTIIVQDAFNSGGAQQTQDVHVNRLSLMSDIDYVRGIHSWRGGVQVDGEWFRSTNSSNSLGTYTFSSLADYEAGRAAVYTQALGNPEVTYLNMTGAVYFQDDIRVRKGLTVSPGVRYSLQNRVDDKGAFDPRVGMTWAPFPQKQTTFRASAGIFHSFLPSFAIEQTLRQDGEKQRELVILNAPYPNPNLDLGFLPPTNKYSIGDFELGRNVRYSAGVDHAFSPRVRLNVLYNYIHLQQQPRGRNLNAPAGGVRPDPRYANVIETVTDTEIRRHELFVNSTINLATPGPAASQKPFNWRRLSMNASYSLLRARNNSAGFFSVPPTGNIEDDWGPGPADSPYRVQLLLTSTQFRNVTMNVSWFANSGGVYTLTTGFDDNRDGIVNDRPAGVGLRSLRMAGQSNVNARFQYAIPFGAPAAGGPPGAGRYRLQLFSNINNLANRQNLGGYSGVMTSPFFLQPTMALNPRSVNFGIGLNF
ncbi:MAG TPA: TonB-dependent receptor [Vicinamibacterales bacterium]